MPNDSICQAYCAYLMVQMQNPTASMIAGSRVFLFGESAPFECHYGFSIRYTYVIPNKEELIAQVEAVLKRWHEQPNEE